jgi:CheY-like chemotaxis protein
MNSQSTNPLEPASESSPAASASTTPFRETSFNGPHKVLVIESDIEMADQLVGLMENVGYQVEVATDGNYGLMLADKFEPEVILLAVDMPGMTGFEVTQTLRNEPRYAQRFRFTRIFYISDKALMIKKRFDAFPGTPMSDYIFTPIDIPELMDKVARALGEEDGAHDG